MTINNEARLGSLHSSGAGLSQQFGRALLWLRPDGWQTKARRNAWAAMVADRQRRAERVSAERELRLLLPAPGLRTQVR